MKETKELAIKLGLIKQRPMSSLFSRMSLNVVQRYKYLVVLDFESTCWENQKYQTQEIIEFPAVLLNTSNGKIESEFHYYVQPQENPTLSSFCKQLTGIAQEQVDEGIPLALCLVKFTYWIEDIERKYNIMFIDANYVPDGVNAGTIVTWTDWDLNICLHYEAKRKQLRIPYQLNNWIDLKLLYKKFYQKKPNGLNGALENVGIRFAGREHSGIDDSRNTAYLAWKMIKDGCEMKITKTLTPTPAVKSCQTTLTQQLKSKKHADINPRKRSIGEKENCAKKWKGNNSPDKCKKSGNSVKITERGKNKGLSIRNKNIFNAPTKRSIAQEQNVPKKQRAVITPEKLKDIVENTLPSIPHIRSCEKNNGKSLSVRDEKIIKPCNDDEVKNKISPFTINKSNSSMTKLIQANPFTTKISLNTNLNAGFQASINNSNHACTYKPFSVYDKNLPSSKMNSAWQVTCSDSFKNNMVENATVGTNKNISNKSMNCTAGIDVTSMQKETNNIERYSYRPNQKNINFHNKQVNHFFNPSKRLKLEAYSNSNTLVAFMSKSLETKPGLATRDLQSNNRDTKCVAGTTTRNIQVNKQISPTRKGLSIDNTKTSSPKNKFNFVSSNDITKGVSKIYPTFGKNKFDVKSMSFNKLTSVQDTTKGVAIETTEFNYNNDSTSKSNFPNQTLRAEITGHLKSRKQENCVNQSKHVATACSKGFVLEGHPKKRQRTISFPEMSATPPVCHCGKRTKRRMVQNPGPNVGRFFFSCSLGSRDSTKAGCGFFQWEKKVVVSKVSHSSSPFHINSYFSRTKDTDN